ncbi:MAG: 50S ribosomal protein L29 [Clostridia bacterium]|jgi:large subunit ribosomal protein L29|nr:50S ribosomal protein L29 [Clostridia bacterium]
MKAEELRKLSSEDLNKKLNELKEELFRLRFQLQINQLDNPNKIPETKRNIARVLTVMNEKNS